MLALLLICCVVALVYLGVTRVAVQWLARRADRLPLERYTVKLRKNPYGGWYYRAYLDGNPVSAEGYTLADSPRIVRMRARKLVNAHRNSRHEQYDPLEIRWGKRRLAAPAPEPEEAQEVDWAALEAEIDRKLGL